MVIETHLDIISYRDQRVPHTFIQQESVTQHLGIVFPGLSYTAHMPVLYYPSELLVNYGADVLRVEYDYTQ